jgi:hypothetical protein
MWVSALARAPKNARERAAYISSAIHPPCR